MHTLLNNVLESKYGEYASEALLSSLLHRLEILNSGIKFNDTNKFIGSNVNIMHAQSSEQMHRLFGIPNLHTTFTTLVEHPNINPNARISLEWFDYSKSLASNKALCESIMQTYSSIISSLYFGNIHSFLNYFRSRELEVKQTLTTQLISFDDGNFEFVACDNFFKGICCAKSIEIPASTFLTNSSDLIMLSKYSNFFDEIIISLDYFTWFDGMQFAFEFVSAHFPNHLVSLRFDTSSYYGKQMFYSNTYASDNNFVNDIITFEKERDFISQFMRDILNNFINYKKNYLFYFNYGYFGQEFDFLSLPNKLLTDYNVEFETILNSYKTIFNVDLKYSAFVEKVGTHQITTIRIG